MKTYIQLKEELNEAVNQNWWSKNQEKRIKGKYNLDTLKKMHEDAIKRVSNKFPEIEKLGWKEAQIDTKTPHEEGYGTHEISSQTEDDETGHNFLISSYYEDGHHVTSIDYGS